MMLFNYVFDVIENNFMTFPFLDINKSQSSIYLILKTVVTTASLPMIYYEGDY